MNFKQILLTAGIAIGAAVGGHYSVPSSELEAAISGIQTVTDSLIPEHWQWGTDTTGAHIDSVLIPARWADISIRVNENKTFRSGDTILFVGIEKQSGKLITNGIVYVVGDDIGDVTYIAKFDRYRK